MLLEISVPDFSTLSRRGRGLSLPARPKIKITDPVHLAIDSTGLKVFDEGEWLQSKYNVKAKRKRWRKLHLGLNLVTGDIVCSDLTLDDVGDPTVLPDLLNQIGTPVSRFIADGAYDGAPTSDLLNSPLIKWLFRLSLPDEECGGENRLAALRDPQCDQHGPGGREQHENTAISARHGLARGAGADELAHQQREVVAGDVKQVSLVHVLAAPKPGPAHAAAIEVVGEGALDDLGAQLEGFLGHPR